MKKTQPKKNSIQEVLTHFTADTMVLYVKTLNFHWNMRGPQFFMYHKLLEDQYKELADALDELAERIRMLGGYAPGSMKEFLNKACMKESAPNLSQDKMIRELVASHEEMVAHAHQLIELSDSQKDQGTSDLVIERLRYHDKQAWLLRSHLQK